MRTYKHIITVMCLLFVLTDLSAQLIPDVKTPVSPESAAIRQYASFPVNHSSGMPDITIPLYEITVGDIILPITLSYISNGLKPQEPMGCVGTGWILNAEPGVSRTVNGMPDNDENSDRDDTGGYFYTTMSGDWRDKNFLKKTLRKTDTEPDQFHYRLATESGSFYVANDNGNARFDPLNMIACFSPNSKIHIDALKNLDSITIKDGRGFIYQFGSTDYRVQKFEYANDARTRILCSKITSSRTDAEITFIHNSQKNYDFSGMYSSDDCVIIEDTYGSDARNSPPILTQKINGVFKSHIIETTSNNNQPKLVQTSAKYYDLLTGMRGNYVSTPRLSKIEFNNGSVVFEYDNTYYQNLSKMTVKDKNNITVKEIIFNICEYEASYANGNNFRTKLKSIKITGPNVDKPMVYQFGYMYEGYMPPINTRSIDHWGYYNNYHSDSDTPSMIPIASVPFSGRYGYSAITIGEMDRSSSVFHTKIGMLQKIVSPEGVETSFDYEGNKACAADSTMNVGGLRIKQINEKDLTSSTNKTIYRTFSYGVRDPGQESGYIMDAGIKNYRNYTIHDYCTAYDISTGGSMKKQVRMWYSRPVYPMSFTNGSAVLYNYVEEKTWNNYDSNQTATNYYFTSMQNNLRADNHHTQSDTFFPTDLKNPQWQYSYMDEYKNGHPLRTEHFKYENGQKTLVSRKDYKYKTDGKTGQHWIPRTKVYQSTIASSFYDEEYKSLSQPVKLYEKYQRLEEEREIFYDYSAGSPREIVKVKQYRYPDDLGWSTYPNHRNPSEIIQVLENGNNLTERFTYMGDVYNLTSTLDRGTNTLNSNKNYNALLEHRRIKSGHEVSTQIKYNNSRVEQVQYKTSQMNNYEPKATFLYDLYGNIIQRYENGLHTAYIWSYDRQYMLAKIENAQYSNIEYDATAKNKLKEINNRSIPVASDITFIKGLYSRIPKAQIFIYDNKPLVGVQKITDPNGMEVLFHYDGLGRLKKTQSCEPGGTPVTLNEYNYNQTSIVR